MHLFMYRYEALALRVFPITSHTLVAFSHGVDIRETAFIVETYAVRGGRAQPPINVGDTLQTIMELVRDKSQYKKQCTADCTQG